nr:MAG TPA: hypothetical protein [Caudoviricetes sp.]
MYCYCHITYNRKYYNLFRCFLNAQSVIPYILLRI